MINIEAFKVGFRNLCHLHTTMAINVLSWALKRDPTYASSWHAVVAVTAQDEGVSHETSQLIATRFMSIAFDVDVTFAKYNPVTPPPITDVVVPGESK